MSNQKESFTKHPSIIYVIEIWKEKVDPIYPETSLIMQLDIAAYGSETVRAEAREILETTLSEMAEPLIAYYRALNEFELANSKLIETVSKEQSKK